ncbi:MAG: hypothetical protein WD226_01285 [Planctomycetota bacterium]
MEDHLPRRGRWSEAERARLQEIYGLRDDASIARELNRPVASVRKMAERLFPEEVEDRPWTADDIENLKRYLGASSVEVIARIFRRSPSDVRARIESLGVATERREWTRDEIAEFKRIYGTRTAEDLVRIFGRSAAVIEDLAQRFALAKDKAFLRRLKGDSATRMPRWTRAEIEQLEELYPTTPNVDLAQQLGRSLKSVVSKAHNLGLRKSPDRLRAMGRENVSLRYHPERAGLQAELNEPASRPEEEHVLRPQPRVADEPAREAERESASDSEAEERTFELRPASRDEPQRKEREREREAGRSASNRDDGSKDSR